MKSRVFTALILLLALSAARPPLWGQGVAQVADGVVVSTPRDQIHFAVCGPTSIHVTAAPQSARPSAPHQPWILQECSGGQFSLAQSDKAATITTAKLKVEIGLRDAGVIFRDAAIVKDLCRIFEEDWKASAPEKEQKQESVAPKKTVKKVARKVAKQIQVAPVAKKVAKVIGKKAKVHLEKKQMQETVKELVQDIAKDAAEHAATEAAKTVA